VELRSARGTTPIHATLFDRSCFSRRMFRLVIQDLNDYKKDQKMNLLQLENKLSLHEKVRRDALKLKSKPEF